jgi:hypothetical protein
VSAAIITDRPDKAGKASARPRSKLPKHPSVHDFHLELKVLLTFTTLEYVKYGGHYSTTSNVY